MVCEHQGDVTADESAGLPTPTDLRYSNDHLWVRREGKEAVIGVTAFACDQLGDVVYVELPAPGVEIDQEEPFGVIESVKSVSDLFAPISGSVIERNEAALASPEMVHDSPYGEGWLVRVEITDSAELDTLLDPATYRETYPGR